MDECTAWLLEGPPWVQYRTRVDLLHQPESNAQVKAIRQAMVGDPQVHNLVDELSDWPGPALTSHKAADHPLHKLTFIADLGLRSGDPGMDQIVSRILAHRSTSGLFQVLVNIPSRYGGTGEDQLAWSLCDASLVLYALARFGLGQEPRIQTAVEYLVLLGRGSGWPCASAPELGGFRGPGRKDDPCPYATLATLKVLALLPQWRASEAAHSGVEALLTLWEQRRDRHPYLFHMGTDFCKLKAPFVWYDILHVLDALTAFSWLRHDERLHAMVNIVKAKADGQGRFVPESIWSTWKEWEFGQKRVPSRWLTFLAQRVLARIGDQV